MSNALDKLEDFIAEWLPHGEYLVLVAVSDDGTEQLVLDRDELERAFEEESSSE